MSNGAIALVSVFGSLGYLLVGWVTVVVIAAMFPYSDGDLPSMAWWALLFWPLALPIGLGWFLYPKIGKATSWAVKKLNPRTTGRWYA